MADRGANSMFAARMTMASPFAQDARHWSAAARGGGSGNIARVCCAAAHVILCGKLRVGWDALGACLVGEGGAARESVCVSAHAAHVGTFSIWRLGTPTAVTNRKSRERD